MKDRQELLTQKAEELRTQTEEWAEQNLSLKPDEFISLTLKVEKRTTVVIKDIDANAKTSNEGEADRVFTEEDWRKILSPSFPKKQKAILDIFKKNNNEPLLTGEIEDLLNKKGFRGDLRLSHIQLLNVAFKRSGINCRLKATKRGVYWTERYYKLVVIE